MLMGFVKIRIELHLRTCADCQATLRSIKAVDRAVHQLSLEEPSTAFTERVLRQLGIRKSVSLGWIIARNLAPLFALSFIVVVLFVVFNAVGAFGGSNVGEPVTVTETFVTSISNSISAGVSSFGLQLEKLFPLAFAKQNYGFTILVIVVLCVVAMLDKFVLNPLWRKRV